MTDDALNAAPTRSFGNAVKWSTLMSVGNQVTNTLVAFVIAAILGPEAFGTVALAVIFLLFAQLLLEQGLSTTIIQRQGLTARHLDAAFWVILATATMLLIGTLVLADWWADVNDAPDLAAVLRVMSPIVLIEALTVVQQALLQRDLRFKELALRANTAAVIGGAAGVIAALAGAGVWALVTQQVVTKTVALALLWIVADWRPGFRFSRAAAAELYGFSARVFLGKAGTFAQSQLDAVIIGVSFGPVAVGLYRMALRISRTIVDAVSQPVALAALPTFSRKQGDRVALDSAFRDAIGRSAGFVVPMAAGAAAVSDLFFRLLGEEWSGAAAVLVVFAVLAIARSVNNLCGPMMMATGRPGVAATLSWALAGLNATTFLIVAWAVRSDEPPQQAFAMAVGRTAAFTVIYLPVTLTVAARAAGTRARTVAAELAPLLLSVPLIVLGARAAVWLLDDRLADFPLLVVAIAVGGVAGAPVLLTLSRPWREIATHVRRLLRRRSTVATS